MGFLYLLSIPNSPLDCGCSVQSVLICPHLFQSDVFFLKNEADRVWLLQRQPITAAVSVLPGGVNVCSYQAAALPPALPLEHVNCTGASCDGGSSGCYRKTNGRLPAAVWGLWGDFVSENNYWWCMSGWKLHLGNSCMWQLWRRMDILQHAGLGTAQSGFYLWMKKGWRLHLENWHNMKLGKNRIEHPPAKASNCTGTADSAVGLWDV